MKINFYKYQGTGNDFIIIDQRNNLFELKTDQISELCDRRFGIGADGLIYLRNKEGYDFQMIYFNSDGRESTMCGNGGRAICRFAADEGIIDKKTHFLAIDGEHEAFINDNEVSLEMINVSSIEESGSDFILNTGSPHYVIFQNNIDKAALTDIAKQIRYSERFKAEGINVNLVEVISDGYLKIRTYERGVEGETLSCGTGVTAAAISYAFKNKWTDKINISSKGGKLSVSFKKEDNLFTNLRLCGPAKFVYKGIINI